MHQEVGTWGRDLAILAGPGGCDPTNELFVVISILVHQIGHSPYFCGHLTVISILLFHNLLDVSQQL